MKKYRFLSCLLALATLFSVLTVPALALDDPQPNCGAAILVDGDYGDILYAKNAYERMYPASTTKIMTSLLVLEAIERGDITLDMPVSASASSIASIPADSSTAGIKAGEILTVEQLLYCDLVISANEACAILAELVGGTLDDFVDLMNTRAAELGMENTHFVNPHGYHDENHYTTAYDLYLVARETMKHEIFRTIVSTPKYVVPATNMSEERVLRTTNALLDNWRITGYTYSRAVGIKTGSTNAAGQCLVSAAVDDLGRTFYCVVLNAENVVEESGNVIRYSFRESRRLLEWGFKNFKRIPLMDETLVIREVPVALSDKDHVLVQPAGAIERTMPIDYNPDLAKFVIDLPESVDAPVAPHQKLGTVTIVYDGEELGTLDLVAMDGAERSALQFYFKVIRECFETWWAKVLVIVFIVLILLLILWLGVIRPRRNRRYRRRSYSGRRRY